MIVSSRQRMILDLLINEEHEMTVTEIADQVQVSTRTVHRELELIEKLLDRFGLKLMKKSGVGVLLYGTDDQKEELRLSLLKWKTTEYTPEERKLMTLCALLEATEPVKLISLAVDQKITTATVSHDLDDLDQWLKKFDLTLIRKRGYGVEIAGSETSKRRAISSLISDRLNEHELIGLIKENIQNKRQHPTDSISERLLSLVEKEKLSQVENALKDLELELSYPLADSAYVGLVVHLTLAVERIEKGERIRFDENTLTELRDTQEFKVAQKIIERLRVLFDLDIPEEEIGYITMHLQGAKQRGSQEDFLWSGNIELLSKTKEFIRRCGESLSMPLSDDLSLLQGLLTHMEPAMYRIRRKMPIRNPLLEQIKNDYRDLFTMIKNVTETVFPEAPLPEEEMGYLVMHIGSAIERVRRTPPSYRALVVCSSGIGSSKILASRIKKEIQEIGGIRNLSMFEVERIPKSEYNLILSTIPLPMDSSKYILVSPLLSENDIQKIKYSIGKLNQTPLFGRDAMDRIDVEEPLTKLRSIRNYLNYSIPLLEQMKVIRIEQSFKDHHEVLEYLCAQLALENFIRDARSVHQQLVNRELLGGLGIPNTHMALFHARSEEIMRPCFWICRLNEAKWLSSMDEKPMEVQTVLMLLAPRNISKEGLELLSEISSLLVDEETKEMLGTGNENTITSYFSLKLHEFITRWGR